MAAAERECQVQHPALAGRAEGAGAANLGEGQVMAY